MNIDELTTLRHDITTWAQELGFAAVGITDCALDAHEAHLEAWLASGYHGEMQYMARHGRRRSRPDALIPGTLRVISVRMDYWPESSSTPSADLDDACMAYISRYALGRDYHKLMRQRLQKLADKINAVFAGNFRAFVDSAPVLEKALAEKAGLGWIGKHSNLLTPKVGSYFFLGELYTDLPLPVDAPFEGAACGRCQRCIDLCPTQAIVAPYQVDARRCISYLTIEHPGSIDVSLRPQLGNRIYGCDDCQIACPWNRFAQQTQEADFSPRHGLDQAALLALFLWDEPTFLRNTEGSAIRRIGHRRWLRNIAVALGNGEANSAVLEALQLRAQQDDELVAEHALWAIEQLTKTMPTAQS